MSVPAWWIIAGAVLALVVGLLLVLAARGLRRRQGLGAGRTVALDNVTLTSRRYGLTGRPDRLIREGDTIIPEEWSSTRAVRVPVVTVKPLADLASWIDTPSPTWKAAQEAGVGGSDES